MHTLKTTVLTMIATAVIILRTGPAIAGSVDTTELIQALIQVESTGNDRAFGDRQKEEKAYGPLQVRQPCVDDVNQRYGTHIQAKDLLGDRATSVWVCQKYLELYATQKRLGHEPTLQDMARIWNGGPSGWKRKDTKVYWAKVSRQLEKIEIAKTTKKQVVPVAIAKAKPVSKPSVNILAVVVER